MGDFNQTPLVYESFNQAATDEDDIGDEEITRILDALGGFTMDDYSDDDFPPSFYDADGFPASFYSNAGNGEVDGFPASLYSNSENGVVDGFPASFYYNAGNGVVDGIPASFYDNAGNYLTEEPITHNSELYESLDYFFLAPDVDRDRVIGEQSAFPSAVSRRNPNEWFLLTGVKTITCFLHAAAIWSIVFWTMVYGVNETGITRISMGSSLLLQPNRFFIKTINVAQPYENNVGPILYGFNSQPNLNVISSWSETHYASVQANRHKEWMYFLNEGSHINISYNIRSSSKLLFMINEGSDGYRQCVNDESSPDATLYWKIVHGDGLIQQNILQSSNYHVAVENLNSEMVKVQLNMNIKALIYDTNEAYYKCKLAQSRCVFPLFLVKANHVVLTTPPLKQGTSDGDWYVELTYGPRWIMFFGGIVVMNGMILVAIELQKKYGGTVK